MRRRHVAIPCRIFMASLLVLVSVAALPAASSAGSAIVQCGFFDCAPTSDPAAPLAVGVPMRPGSSRFLNAHSTAQRKLIARTGLRRISFPLQLTLWTW